METVEYDYNFENIKIDQYSTTNLHIKDKRSAINVINTAEFGGLLRIKLSEDANGKYTIASFKTLDRWFSDLTNDSKTIGITNISELRKIDIKNIKNMGEKNLINNNDPHQVNMTVHKIDSTVVKTMIDIKNSDIYQTNNNEYIRYLITKKKEPIEILQSTTELCWDELPLSISNNNTYLEWSNQTNTNYRFENIHFRLKDDDIIKHCIKLYKRRINDSDELFLSKENDFNTVYNPNNSSTSPISISIDSINNKLMVIKIDNIIHYITDSSDNICPTYGDQYDIIANPTPSKKKSITLSYDKLKPRLGYEFKLFYLDGSVWKVFNNCSSNRSNGTLTACNIDNSNTSILVRAIQVPNPIQNDDGVAHYPNARWNVGLIKNGFIWKNTNRPQEVNYNDSHILGFAKNKDTIYMNKSYAIEDASSISIVFPNINILNITVPDSAISDKSNWIFGMVQRKNEMNCYILDSTTNSYKHFKDYMFPCLVFSNNINTLIPYDSRHVTINNNGSSEVQIKFLKKI